MRKRSKALAALLCVTIAISAGCSGKKNAENTSGSPDKEGQPEGEEGAVEGEEYLNWIKEAWEDYQAEEIKGYADSSLSYRTVNTINMAARQIKTEEFYVSEGTEELKSTEFLTKEGENNYLYKEEHVFNSPDAVNLKILLDSGNGDQMTYDDYIAQNCGELFEDDADTEIIRISVIQDGEEEIDGISAEKFTVEYETKAKAGGELTKEELMKEHGWTEEHLALLEGMSEAVELYVSMANAEADRQMEEPVTKRETFYLTSDGHKLVRSQKIIETGNSGDSAIKDLGRIINSYENSAGRDYGESEQEIMDMAVQMASVDMEYIMEDIRNWQVDSVELVTDYLTGAQCGSIGDLPADAQEVTWEQYRKQEF